MPHIYIVSWKLSPAPTASAWILSNLATHFSKHELTFFGEIERKNAQSDAGSPSHDTTLVDPFISSSNRGVRYTRWLKSSSITRQLRKDVLRKKATCIFALFPDEFFLYSAYRVSRSLGIPLYLWMHNTYLENRSGPLKILARRFQPLVFGHAQKIFTISDGLTNYYNKQYPRTGFSTLAHPFRLPDSPPVGQGAQPALRKFAYTGSLSESCLDASKRLIEVILEDPKNEVHIASGTPLSAFQDLVSTPGEKSRLIHHGFFPTADELAAFFDSCDVCLLPHGLSGGRDSVEYATIFPTRTVPLLFSGKPILAHSPKDSFLTEFLDRFECCHLVDSPDKEEIRATLKTMSALNEDENRRLVKNSWTAAQCFDSERIANQLRNTIVSP